MVPGWHLWRWANGRDKRQQWPRLPVRRSRRKPPRPRSSDATTGSPGFPPVRRTCRARRNSSGPGRAQPGWPRFHRHHMLNRCDDSDVHIIGGQHAPGLGAERQRSPIRAPAQQLFACWVQRRRSRERHSDEHRDVDADDDMGSGNVCGARLDVAPGLRASSCRGAGFVVRAAKGQTVPAAISRPQVWQFVMQDSKLQEYTGTSHRCCARSGSTRRTCAHSRMRLISESVDQLIMHGVT